MKPVKSDGRPSLSRMVILYQIVCFAVIILFLWLDEIFDLPHYLFGSIETPVNIVESVLESVMILFVAIFCVWVSERFLSRIKVMEGMLPICANCKRIRDDNNHWWTVEKYIETRSNASFSHGLCQECIEKLYGDQEWFQKKGSKRPPDQDA